MKPIILKLSTVILLFAFIGAGCKDDEETMIKRATGEIILVTRMCYGEAVIIEVDNPVGIGKEGTFAFIGDTNRIEYQNAISVPYFSKIPEIPDSIIPNIGLEIDFEYRELEEGEASLFNANLSDPCLWIISPPNTKPYMITKINNH